MSIEAKIKQSLSDSIANFGYPVGMGLPPPDEALDKMTIALLAALGETHVVVPREPTEKMLEAVDCAGDKKKWLSGRAWIAGWKAMVAAAVPSPDRCPDKA